jgi:hypothetical protein
MEPLNYLWFCLRGRFKDSQSIPRNPIAFFIFVSTFFNSITNQIATNPLRENVKDQLDPAELLGLIWIELSQLNGLQQFVMRIPPARFLDIAESLFSLKRFQRNGGVAKFPNEP